MLADLGVAPEDAAMVGDDVETDVGGALNAGLSGFLVRTGKYREEFVARVGDRADRDDRLDRGAAGPARGLSAWRGRSEIRVRSRSSATGQTLAGEVLDAAAAPGRVRPSCCCTR